MGHRFESCYSRHCICGNSSVVERHLAKVKVASSNLVSRSTSRRAFWFAVFLCKNTASLCRLPLLFRKKARSAQRLTCRRVRDVSLSLPPFCEYTIGAGVSLLSCFSMSEWTLFHSDFLYQKIHRKRNLYPTQFVPPIWDLLIICTITLCIILYSSKYIQTI